MARRATALVPRPVVVQIPRARRIARRRVGGSPSRRRGARAIRTAASVTPALAMPVAIGGAIVGWAGARGFLSRLPAIMGSRTTTLGLAGWLALRYAKSKPVRAAGLAALAVAAFDIGRVQGGGQRLLGDEISAADDF